MEKTGRRAHRLCWGTDTYSHKRIGTRRKGGRYPWRSALSGRPMLLCPLPIPFQSTHPPTQPANGEQMDVFLGRHYPHAVSWHPHYNLHTVGERSRADMVGRCLRGILRNVRELSSLHQRPAHATPYGGKHLQLCATAGVGNGERALRTRHV